MDKYIYTVLTTVIYNYIYILLLYIDSIRTNVRQTFQKRTCTYYIASLKEKLEGLRAKSEKDIWIDELEEFENAYKKWLQEIEQEAAVAKKRRATKTKK